MARGGEGGHHDGMSRGGEGRRGGAALDHRNQKGSENSNAQWSTGAAKGQDRSGMRNQKAQGHDHGHAKDHSGKAHGHGKGPGGQGSQNSDSD